MSVSVQRKFDASWASKSVEEKPELQFNQYSH